MKIRPELAALQRDDAPQRRIQAELQAVVERWRGGPAMAGIATDLARFADGRRLDELLSLAALFAPDGPAAATFAADLVRLIGAELGRQPLAHVPLRHFTNDLITSLLLARCGDVSLSLEAVDGTALPRISPPASVSFSPSQTWERVLAGSGEIERITLAAVHPAGVATLTRQPERVRAGMVIHRDGASEALVLRAAPRSLITLNLQRGAAPGEVACEYALADGRPLCRAAAHPRDSRFELAAALLGRMGRRDAAPLLAELANEPGSASLRWQALRECLGLDTAIGFAALCRLAGRDGDPLAAPAAALQAQLVADHPQLAGIVPCPA